MKIKTSKKIKELICVDEPMYDWSKVADFSISYGDRVEDISFKDAFNIGLLSSQHSKDIRYVKSLPIYRIFGEYGMYFFVGTESQIIKKIQKFMK